MRTGRPSIDAAAGPTAARAKVAAWPSWRRRLGSIFRCLQPIDLKSMRACGPGDVKDGPEEPARGCAGAGGFYVASLCKRVYVGTLRKSTCPGAAMKILRTLSLTAVLGAA